MRNQATAMRGAGALKRDSPGAAAKPAASPARVALGRRAAAAVSAPLREDAALAIASRMLIAVSLLALGAGLASGFEIAVFIVASFGWALAVMIVRSPKTGLLGLLVLCAVDPAMRVYVFLPLGLPHNTFNYLLLLLILISPAALSRHADIRMRLLAAFAALLAVEIALSSNLFMGVQATFEVVVGFGVIAALFRGGFDDRFLGRAAIGIGMATACLTLVYYVRPPAEYAMNVNALVHVPLAALVTAALAVARPMRRNWLLLGLLVTVNFGFAFITSSRGGFAVASLLALFILWRTPSFRWKSYSIAAAIIAITAAGYFFGNQYTESVHKWGRFADPTLTAAEYTNKRSELAELGWASFLQNPLGTGTGSFVHQSAASGQHSRGMAAHSAWVKTMTENGLLGLLLLLAFVISFAVARPVSPKVTRAIGPLTAIAMSALFVTSEFQSKAIWLLVAGTLVLLQQTDRPTPFAPGTLGGSGLRRGVIRPRRQGGR